jgi:hypothetical protein
MMGVTIEIIDLTFGLANLTIHPVKAHRKGQETNTQMDEDYSLVLRRD